MENDPLSLLCWQQKRKKCKATVGSNLASLASPKRQLPKNAAGEKLQPRIQESYSRDENTFTIFSLLAKALVSWHTALGILIKRPA